MRRRAERVDIENINHFLQDMNARRKRVNPDSWVGLLCLALGALVLWKGWL